MKETTIIVLDLICGGTLVLIVSLVLQVIRAKFHNLLNKKRAKAIGELREILINVQRRDYNRTGTVRERLIKLPQGKKYLILTKEDMDQIADIIKNM